MLESSPVYYQINFSTTKNDMKHTFETRLEFVKNNISFYAKRKRKVKFICGIDQG